MKLQLISSAAVMLAASTSYAQVATDSTGQSQPREVTLVSGNDGKHAREADARHCLNLKDNTAIIRCAEPYRYRGVPGN